MVVVVVVVAVVVVAVVVVVVVVLVAVVVGVCAADISCRGSSALEGSPEDQGKVTAADLVLTGAEGDPNSVREQTPPRSASAGHKRQYQTYTTNNKQTVYV